VKKLKIKHYPDPYESTTVFAIAEEGLEDVYVTQLDSGSFTRHDGRHHIRDRGAIEKFRQIIKNACDYHEVKVDLSSDNFSNWGN
jgi:hypothetical protein